MRASKVEGETGGIAGSQSKWGVCVGYISIASFNHNLLLWEQSVNELSIRTNGCNLDFCGQSERIAMTPCDQSPDSERVRSGHR
jgi:hypothetical protein